MREINTVNTLCLLSIRIDVYIKYLWQERLHTVII